MVNSYLPGRLRQEIFAGYIVNNGFFCPPTNPGGAAYDTVFTQ